MLLLSSKSHGGVMSFLNRGAYEFSNWKMNITGATDKNKLINAAELVGTAMQILEMIDDEYQFPVSEYETLADIRTDLINYAQDIKDDEA